MRNYGVLCHCVFVFRHRVADLSILVSAENQEMLPRKIESVSNSRIHGEDRALEDDPKAEDDEVKRP